MPYVFQESLEEFVARHGRPAVQITPRTKLLPDGAYIHNDGIEGQRFEEPSENLRVRLEAQRRYHTMRAEIYESNFTKLKSALMGMGVGFSWDYRLLGPDPGGDGTQAVIMLRDLAHEQRLKAAALNAEIEALPEMIERRKHQAERQAFEEEQRRREAAFRASIAAIGLKTIDETN